LPLGSFTLDIQRFVNKAKGNVDLVIRKVALDLFKRVILKSPVLSGRFKSNWQVAINSIPSGVYETFDKDGGATIARVAAGTIGARAGDVITLVNALDYARPSNLDTRNRHRKEWCASQSWNTARLFRKPQVK
jgi:hypothetical protein